MTVARSPWGAARAVWWSLHQNLWTVAQEINGELLAAGGQQQLTAPASVRLVSQVPQAPATTLPAVVVHHVNDDDSGSPHTPSAARRDFAAVVQVAIYDQGTPGQIATGAAGSTVSYDAELDVELRLLAWAEAVRRCLQRPSSLGGVHGAGGIGRLKKTGRARELFAVDEDGVVTCAAEIVTFTLECKGG